MNPNTHAETILRSRFNPAQFPDLVVTYASFYCAKTIRLTVDATWPATTPRAATLLLPPQEVQFFDFKRNESIVIPTASGGYALPSTWADTNLDQARKLPENTALAIDSIACEIEPLQVGYPQSPSPIATPSLTDSAYTGNATNPATRIYMADPAGIVQPVATYSDHPTSLEMGLRTHCGYKIQTRTDGAALLSGSLRDVGSGELGTKRGGFGDGVNSTEKRVPDGIIWDNTSTKTDAELYFSIKNDASILVPVASVPQYPGASTYATANGGTVRIRVTVRGWFFRPKGSINV